MIIRAFAGGIWQTWAIGRDKARIVVIFVYAAVLNVNGGYWFKGVGSALALCGTFVDIVFAGPSLLHSLWQFICLVFPDGVLVFFRVCE